MCRSCQEDPAADIICQNQSPGPGPEVPLYRSKKPFFLTTNPNSYVSSVLGYNKSLPYFWVRVRTRVRVTVSHMIFDDDDDDDVSRHLRCQCSSCLSVRLLDLEGGGGGVYRRVFMHPLSIFLIWVPSFIFNLINLVDCHMSTPKRGIMMSAFWFVEPFSHLYIFHASCVSSLSSNPAPVLVNCAQSVGCLMDIFCLRKAFMFL